MTGLDYHVVTRLRLDRRAVRHAVDDPPRHDVLVGERRAVVHAHARLGVLRPRPAGPQTRAPDDRVAYLDRLGVAVGAVFLRRLRVIEALDVDAHLVDLQHEFEFGERVD